MTMSLLILLVLASAAVARAFINLGEMSYKLKWVNYPIAFLSALLGATLALNSHSLRSASLVIAIVLAIAALAIYHLLRRRFIADGYDETLSYRSMR